MIISLVDVFMHLELNNTRFKIVISLLSKFYY